MPPAPSPDRLSALDYGFIALDSAEAPLHVGWTMRFDGDAPSLAGLRRHLEARLGFVPRFRRCVSIPALGLGDPRWVDDPGFDIAHHVHDVTLAAPGGPAELRTLAGTLLSRPLDPGRPLWQLYLVRGVGSGFALVGQAHHALVDGIAAIEVAMLLFTPEPPQRDGADTGDWRPARRPAPARAAAAAVGARAKTAVRLAKQTTPAPSVRGAARRAAGLPGDLKGAAGGLERLTSPVPSTALDRAVGGRRAVAYAQAPLDGLKAAGRRHSATLNDVLLTACALAFGRALALHGQQAEELRVLVPVNTRADDPAGLGNQISFMAVELPAANPNPVTVLRTVRDRTRAAKAAAAAGSDGLGMAQLLKAADLLPAQAAGAVARLAYRAAAFNAIVSNVPGPEVELSLLGRPLRSVYPAVPVAPGHALSIGALSYMGRLHVGLYADADALPDLPSIAHDLERALDTLRVDAPVAPTPWRARARARRGTRTSG
ncbi:wax ester/triacylglycerol synthase family O-acyltransferase [Paraconexibacter antarcticus]|uniref:Diacylglycerol O-acyltransferase n=1 Tax=Paraconexibacter antarcticus TaxID=2949664 RepID=A0ABY5DYC9_9ACTN|nr:wax ester/triacylglycerol synthase family O-acyltransferase [Paraconexibacter antarcticus]UTI65652.1 wax ester/triacylglycerol synthase family O-acyltransferase [Paraconexibacter antarcticus]